MKKKHVSICTLLVFLCCTQCISCNDNDLTSSAFGSRTDGMPAAFGDFNSDELTDLFVIRDDGASVEILLGTTKEPYFWQNSDPRLRCSVSGYVITSVVPGDFDGDALMDVLVTARKIGESQTENPFKLYIFIEWGNITSLSCSHEYLFTTIDEPLAIDYSKNMSTDLFGVNEDNKRTIWLFHKDRSFTNKTLQLPNLPNNKTLGNVRVPQSHAFVDLNQDNSPDLYVTGKKGYEIWLWNSSVGTFVYSYSIQTITGYEHVGQTLFMDLETIDKMYHIVPVSGSNGLNSAIQVFAKGQWYNLNVNFLQDRTQWGFADPNIGLRYTDTITLRAGDFNNDGYVDFLATLCQVNNCKNKFRTFLFENVPCTGNCNLSRSFEIKWDALSNNENTVMGAFYDFFQDGILDIIFVHLNKGKYNVSAFKNALDYDANFVKVMVVTGAVNNEIVVPATILGPKRRTFGTNLPGAKIRYKTTTQDGNLQAGVSVQLPQSAHFALYLPYTIFGLGRTPNFIEDLTIGLFNETRTWNQIIPNSQLVVIPYPPDEPSQWRAQLFVTPSKIVLQTVAALAGTCVMIGCIIGALHWKERREDRVEKLQEAHRFHFDAM